MKTYLICISLFFFSAASYSTQLDDSDLTLEPTDSIDSELPVLSDLSKLELELDARITYEAARGSANLDALMLIEHELIASSISETNPVLLSRILQLKYLALDKEAENSITYIQNTESIGAKSETRRRKGRSASAQTESAPPELTSISVDKVSVDVTENSQTVTFTVEGNDATGVDWSASRVVLQDEGGKYMYARADTPGIFTLIVDSNDASGTWTILWLRFKDTLGNEKVYRYESSLKPRGLPAFIYVLESGEATTNLALSTATSITNVSENSEINYTLTIENLASTPSGQLTLELESTNVRVNAVSQAGSSACSISSANYNSTVSCKLSGVDANSSKQLNLTLSAGAAGTGSLNANIVASIPDISYLNNYLTVSLGIDPDSDGDGIGDNADAFPNDSTETVDTDLDGVGDNADVFPLDASESSDFDGDGV
ncbi:MAG: hypothetical protein HOI09_01410, partial [Porticoccaceae bacterium]|nr:hypothetical protein [Porticoccaceae bacterium]